MMKTNAREFFFLFFFLFLFFFSIVCSSLSLASRVIFGKQTTHEGTTCHFSAIYNFGDSNSDTGGGSAAFYLPILPAGETFFHRAVGRASDGRLIIDFLAERFGFEYLSPYLDSIGTNFKHGANFAIGGATIRSQNESISLNGVPPFSLDVQVVQFFNFKSRTHWFYKQGKKSSQRRRNQNLPKPHEFSKALYILDIGQNDISAGFRSMTNKQFLSQIPDIIKQFGRSIQDLYDHGARAFWVHNTGPIGCLAVALRDPHNPDPSYIDRHGCVRDKNDIAQAFNRLLKKEVSYLRDKLPLAALTYVDIYSAKYELISNAKKQGFLDKTKICCGYHEGNDHVWCGNTAKLKNGTRIYAASCEDPSAYVSWDGVHYTEAANRWIADRIINGSFSDPPIPITHACYKR